MVLKLLEHRLIVEQKRKQAAKKKAVIAIPQNKPAHNQNKKLLTSKNRYVSIRSMHARYKNLTKAAHRAEGGLHARRLNVDTRGLSLLILVSFLALLILGRGAGIG